MSNADAAARAIERLLVDPAFRADFRRDPVTCCRAAGLDAVADEMAGASGKALQTLDIRESRSSLAGVLMAAAFEGIGVLELVERSVAGVPIASAAVHDVLSRVDLPTIASARRAQVPAARPAGPAQPPVPAALEPRTASAAHATPVSAPRAPSHDGGSSHGGDRTPRPRHDSSHAAAPVHVDPQQFGAEGHGGPPNAEALALLRNEHVVLDADGISDIKAGRIDPRIVAVLTKLSERHTIRVSCMCSDHPVNTTSGSVSNHHYGRGADIAAIDGQPVNAGSLVARDIASELGSLDPRYRPDEIGTPWQIAPPRYFHDAFHNDHLHVGFDRPIAADWRPPADVRARGDGAAVKRGPSHRDAGRAVAEHAGHGAGRDLVAGPRALAALKEALRYTGLPYRYGGSTPQTGFDCSGLAQWVYAKQGIRLPRVADQQFLAPSEHIGRAQLEPGDLVFFKDPTGHVHHVGISIGGDAFLHSPRTGKSVMQSSLTQPYFAQQFAGGRRFDQPSRAGGATPDPGDVKAALDAHARDALDAQRPETLTFKALIRQEARKHDATVQILPTVRPDGSARSPHGGEPAHAPSDSAPDVDYPGDDAPQSAIAGWMARQAERAGLPRELPVMAALVESSLENKPYGDRDSRGYFQMRLSVWNRDRYEGYASRPELQLQWFIDRAVAVKNARLQQGRAGLLADDSSWGDWIADVERCDESLRYKYQQQLSPARRLLGGEA